MNDILLGQVLKRLNEAASQLAVQIKTVNEQQELKVKSEQDKQAIVERNHRDIQAASNKEILRKQLELLAEYSRLPEGHEHMAECSIAMVLLYRELARPDNCWLSRKKGKAEQHEHK